ncbi:MAG: thiamine phosphate synthase [Acinetobacter sp.]
MRGLYLITNDDPIQLLLEKLAVALATGQIAILQYRRKNVAKIEQPFEVEQIKALCEKYQVPLVINDDVTLAASFGLGVHLGQSDGEISDALQRLQPNVIIGRTCLNSLELAEKALAEGATYVAFGAVYATSTKPEAGTVSIDIIQKAKQQFDVPICVIGGLTVENAQVVINAGASLCAVISDILGRSTAEIPARVNAWAKLFT